MEFIKTFLGGAGGAALVAGIFALIQQKMARKAKSQDTKDAELKELKRMVDVLCLADRTILYDRIKHLGKSYIDREYVTVEELEDLGMMHSVYHDPDKLNGNGFLDGLMTDVRGLPKRAK